jgi:hypothetical protein
MFGEDNFDFIGRLINAWNPKKEYQNETEYRDDLLDFLRQSSQKPEGLFGTSKKLTFLKEDGRSLADIALGKEIGIELKKDLRKQSDIDRLLGQLNRHRREYRDMIIVLVGKTQDEAFEKLKKERNILVNSNENSFLESRQRIGIIKK